MSSNASSSHCWKRDVFLSFRGEDTRRGFTDHLYNTLKQKGVDTFRDDEKLERGKDINPELLRSIEESRFAVVIFSRNYACSKWCLDELQKIAECKKNTGQTVLPVFHGVDPSHVRKQEGDFQVAFDKHEQDFKDNTEKVNKWREALIEVANVSGWDLTNRHESEVIQEIAKTILNKLNLIFSTDNKDLVGIDSRMLKMDSYLDIRSDDVRTIGIWGAGGIGKTTLAKQIFKRIRDEFEASCFLANVREESQKHGIVHMQTLLYEILAQNQAKIQMDDMGVDVLIRALHSKRVLVVLDDVDQLKHLEALVGRGSGQHHWFGSGSRIIVTTRDKHLLKMYGNIVYEVEKLDNVEALQLFSQRSFNQDCPPDDDYKKLSESVVKYADGLPLALEVLGSFLYGRDKDEWSGTIRRLRDNPKSEIYKTLRLSYDGLEQTEKQTFLDIACFFKGEDVVRVNKILDGCEFHPTIGIRVLNEKSLIFIEGGKLWMHDLLQEMGREIVREESPQEPGKRSRLWLHKDSYQVLAENKGTSAVHGIFLGSQAKEEMLYNANPFLEIRDLRPVRIGKPVQVQSRGAEIRDVQKLLRIDQEVHLNCDPFVELKNLRLLKIRNVKISGCLNYSLPKSLRLLEWHGYPLKSLPSNFQLENLVELSMPNSRIEQLPKLEALRLGMLISIDLSNCGYLINTPDFTKIPNLEILILEGCIKLQEVHPSVGVLEHLVLLNLNGCKCLQKLPDKISLRSLEMFILSGCSNLNKFPEIVGDMKNLSQLYLDGTAIRELPISINQLTGLTLLHLSYCKNLSSLPSNEICGLTALRTLCLSHCSKIDQLPENLGSLKELEELYANGTAVRRVPSSILCLDNLKHLSFRGCHTGSGMQRSWKSIICCCLLPTDHHSEVIGLQLPSSFAGLTSLISLDLSHCNLQEGALPNDIGCLSSLQSLDLSGNNFKVIPESFSQLFKLRELDLSDCRELMWLPHPLPLSLKYLYARNCPNLVTELSRYRDMEILISDNGFHFIDCRKSSSFGDDQACIGQHSMPEEYIDLLFPKYIEDSINHGRSFHIIFPYPARIPEWCSKWSDNGSSITVKLSPEDNFGMRKGFALFFAFEIKEQDKIHEGLELQKTACLFHSDEGGYLSLLPDFKMLAAGSFGVCCYLPRGWFQEKYLNQASSVFGALILTERQDLEIKMCGLHIIFEQDVEEFSQKLFKTHTQFRDLDLSFIQHCKKFLDLARGLDNLGEPSTVWDYSSRKEQGSGEPQKDHVEPTCATKDPNSSSEDCVDDWTTQMRRDTQTLLSRLFEGRYAHYNPFSFNIPVETVSSWFLHHCVGDTAICYLPSNLYDDERWVGLDVYVRFKRSNPSETPSLLFADFYAHGTHNGMLLPILSLPLTMNGLLESSFVVSHVPRAYFPKQLNQCQGISVLFRPVALSNVKVDLRVVICGTRLLYEQDSTSFIDKMVNLASIHPFLLQTLHYQAKSHLQKVEEFLCKTETHKQIEVGKQQLGPSSLEWSFLQSLQKLLTSTEPLAKDVANTLEKYRFYRAQNKASRELGPMLVHSKEFFSEILHHMQRSAQVRGLTCWFNHFHILPDKFLRFGGELNEWRHDLESLLKLFYKDEGLLITLSVGGKLIAVTKRFDPNLVFNFCFPQKEMLDCFQDRSSTSRVAIELPPNLYNDSSWEGLAVCAAFSVNEHPNAFSETSVDLLCHLSVNGHCLNPVPSFSITKDRYKWLHLRGFIWLTYLPRMILIELDQQRNVEARIFSSCPGLIVNMCGIRVLYHQDVEEFRHTIIQCSTSIFDTSDIFQYVDPFGVGIGTLAGLLFNKDESSLGITDEQNTPLHANDQENNTKSRVVDESTIDQSTFRQTSNEEFDQNSIYNSCFPAIEIQDWFGDQSRFDSSGKIYLPPDINGDNNWIGLAMCAYFSDSETTDIDHNSDPEIVPHVTLVCQFETENGSVRPLRHHQTTVEDLNLLRCGGLMWLSFLPRRWFYEANHEAPYQLNECRVMKAAFESNIRGVCVRRCAFRLLYQHEVEEFKQTIRHCVLNTSSPCDKKLSESSADKLLKDKGKRILE